MPIGISIFLRVHIRKTSNHVRNKDEKQTTDTRRDKASARTIPAPTRMIANNRCWRLKDPPLPDALNSALNRVLRRRLAFSCGLGVIYELPNARGRLKGMNTRLESTRRKREVIKHVLRGLFAQLSRRFLSQIFRLLILRGSWWNHVTRRKKREGWVDKSKKKQSFSPRHQLTRGQDPRKIWQRLRLVVHLQGMLCWW